MNALVVGLTTLFVPPVPAPVPFELLKTGHMVVQVKINGKGPYRVVFDTGSPVTLLSTSVARESGLLGKDARRPGLGMLGGVSQVRVKEVQVGSVKAANVPAIVMDHPAVEALSRAFGPVEGIVGFPFFARFKMTLDYQAKQLTFVPNGYDPPDVLEALLATVMAMRQNQGAPAKVLAPAAQWGLVVAKESEDDEAGVTVKEVRAGGAAAAAGLRAGDRLLTLDDRWTDSVADCYDAAGRVKPGAAVKVVLRRDGKELEITVRPRAGI